jgi:DNA-binding transcriptional MerR regulator
MSNERQYTIHDLSLILGVNKSTIRYWEKKRLIPSSRRCSNNIYRTYNIKEIKEIAKLRGFFDLDIDKLCKLYPSKKIRKNITYVKK